MKRYVVIVLVLLSSWVAGAQNLSGFWKGSLSMSSGCFPENNIELQISVDGTAANGDSYHYLDIDNYVKKDFTGSWEASSKKIIVQENIVTTFRIRPNCQVCIKRYELYYSRNGNVETLTGSWTGRIMGTGISCDTGNITLRRIRESAFKEIPEVGVDTGKLRLDFYDNNQVDGNSITVKVNGKVILSNQKLSTKPVTAYVTIDPATTFQEVEMIAENLGSIPPNTAMLIVTAGKDRYQLFLSSTETKSARVRFIYDEKKRGILRSAGVR